VFNPRSAPSLDGITEFKRDEGSVLLKKTQVKESDWKYPFRTIITIVIEKRIAGRVHSGAHWGQL
jgi:hypothetical protein